MNWKTYALTILCLATVTACAHPVDQAIGARSQVRQETLEQSASISGGACDDVGQLIPGASLPNTGRTWEASAAPTRR